MPLEYYSCKPCDKVFNGKRPYEDHIVSANHQKKMNMKAMERSTVVDSSTRTTQIPSQHCSDPFIIPRGSGYYCNICDLPLNGPEQMKDHIVGSKHLKMMKSKQPHDGCGDVGSVDLSTMKMSDSPKDFSDLTTQVPSQHSSDPFIIRRGSRYYCTICDLYLNGPGPLKAHIVGNKHLRMKSKQPLDGCSDVGNVDRSAVKMSDSPKDISDSYDDIEKALKDVKVFKVDELIEF